MPMDRHMRAIRRADPLPLPPLAASEEPREAVELEVVPVPLDEVSEPQEQTSQASEGTETPDPGKRRKKVVPDPGEDFSFAASLIE